ncbi:hypothetical protein R3X28_15035 [Maribacter sp. TH_r10]|uniref:hypothetical protein n=1 Tax=Maribacter sp. TH_r10 TaxID=3082086 RepID=UPI002954E659|nr:hypothetical protein [Maribacter sp. TH_r10]MDV7140205.1 hypothetical protein [Maribacter sp. TH_r10]
MEVKKEPIFQIDDPAVKKIYREADNYKVKFHSGPAVQEDLCIIYFSSNDLYYPNTPKAFENSIVAKDKFEWQRNYIQYAKKHIFLRDVQKQWYIEGISEKHDNPEALWELLRELTSGFRVYVMGSSAGGFAALLYGSLLRADRVYAFNAQLNLNVIIEGSNAKVDPILFRYKDQERSKYFVIEDFLDTERDYFYFQSSKSILDIKQYNALKNTTLLTRIPFKTGNHGFPFLRHNLRYVLGLSKEELHQLSFKSYHPIAFAASIDGWAKTVQVVVTTVVNRFKKKLKEKKAAF